MRQISKKATETKKKTTSDSAFYFSTLKNDIKKSSVVSTSEIVVCYHTTVENRCILPVNKGATWDKHIYQFAN